MNSYSKEVLEDLILKQNKSYCEIGREYNVSGAAIKKAALKLGITLPIRRITNEKETFNRGKHKLETLYCKNCGKIINNNTNKSYCSVNCQMEYQHKLKYEKLISGDPSIMRANYSPKNFRNNIMEEQNNKCAICGMSPEWNGKKLVFIIDHIDGNAANNKRSNLRCICPNCDSQLDTYKSKNKNGARSYYRYHKYL